VSRRTWQFTLSLARSAFLPEGVPLILSLPESLEESNRLGAEIIYQSDNLLELLVGVRSLDALFLDFRRDKLADFHTTGLFLRSERKAVHIALEAKQGIFGREGVLLGSKKALRGLAENNVP